MKKRGVILILAVVVLGLAVFAHQFIKFSRQFGEMLRDTKPHPTEVKICDIKEGVAKVEVVWPNAELFQFLVSLSPRKGWSKYDPTPEIPLFEGVILISDSHGNLLDSISINRETASKCNWLDDEALDAYILTWKNKGDLESLKAGDAYSIKISFSEIPDNFDSIWLSYIQTTAQKSQEQPK